MKYVDDEVGAWWGELDQETRARADTDRAESDARGAGDDAFGRLLADAAAGSVHFSPFGLGWLAVGSP
ncbi:hypothetical protein HZ992_12640 [Rhizobacter sp. AJA081-3]|uniref:hypothetical protein n=1 Tax=Rhizobacter sp. AJA081-3 TaxID=2753607 RepID=UPI001AE0B211|nr:hypothetical protein [Rhizobacter sp. AJA081-3]QTN25738.1 hypothetical protein HZ992_12640 [Rhizobacter sp. AJA081-3]